MHGYSTDSSERRVVPFLLAVTLAWVSSMMESNTGLANEVIERILELSADAHIRRRATVKDSPAFDNLTGAIAAYGKVLAFLTELKTTGRILRNSW